jgi:predicted molibdopterin-dependent oxidoreductase YjgC
MAKDRAAGERGQVEQPVDAHRFRALDAVGRPVPVTIDDREILLPDGMQLAAALMTAGHLAVGRSPGRGDPRGPLCLMGSCFQCVATVDGRPERACRTWVHAGMVIGLGL